MTDSTEFTDQERNTIRTAAFGSIFLVSNADPGFLATIKESFAGSKALAGASPTLQSVFKSGGMPKLPKGSPAEIENSVLTSLQEATHIIYAKAPAELDPFRNAIVAACQQVADAHSGANETEVAATRKVMTALGYQ